MFGGISRLKRLPYLAALFDYAVPVRNLSLDQNGAGSKRKNTVFGSLIIIVLQELQPFSAFRKTFVLQFVSVPFSEQHPTYYPRGFVLVPPGPMGYLELLATPPAHHSGSQFGKQGVVRIDALAQIPIPYRIGRGRSIHAHPSIVGSFDVASISIRAKQPGPKGKGRRLAHVQQGPGRNPLLAVNADQYEERLETRQGMEL
jgi:hypothetical protein